MGDTKQLAQTYTVVNNTQYDAGLFLIKRLELEPGMRVLDVGCGPGNLTSYLTDLVGEGGEVVGIDPSEERIALARETTTRDTGRKNPQFHVGRAEDLAQFPAASFDVVYCNSTLHWVADQPRALREFGRVLRAGGRLGVSGQSGDFVAAHERIQAAVLARTPYRDYDHGTAGAAPRFLTREQMGALLDLAGFGGGDRTFTTNKIFNSSGKTYGGVPVEMRPQAREEMIAEWDKLATKDGLMMELDLLVTVATKA
ncbi:methyltransferase domain-containing protein [Apiospora phragmitis]|uniref:Methyltransferase domain-containing protein n=1 Tax=Apiospora phragmitis TaxID=2905665 RepID=A0ABR1VEX1_9PEZI